MNADTLIYLVLTESRGLSRVVNIATARKARSSGGPSSSSPPPTRTDGKWEGRPINPGSKDFRDRLRSSIEGNLTSDQIGRPAGGPYPGFRNLKFKNGRRISIQASEIHHSQPRVGGLHPHQYTHWEVGVLDNLHNDPEFKKKFGHLVTHDLGDLGVSVSVSVPTKDVQKMVDHIDSMPSLK